MKFAVFIALIFGSFLSMAQETSPLEERERVLDSLLTGLRAAENDSEKKIRNDIFLKEMDSFLNSKGAMDYKFSKLKTVGIIDSPDKKVRIVNWNVEQDDLNHNYYCFVLFQDEKKDEVRVTQLTDISFGMPSKPEGAITADEWYGALYYKIIPVKKGSRTMYTLLGWDHNSSLSQMKLIDVMYFTGSTVKLGYPIFKIGKKTERRVFFEYSKKATMYMNYESDRKRIMMDHLSPESPALKAFRSYYVPDLSYDAFVYKGKKWELVEDVIGVNHSNGEKKQTVFVKNEKTGELEERTIKKKWINPEDPNAPAGGSEHVAVTPETETKSDPKDKKDPSTKNDLDKRVNKRDKRDPNDLSSVNGGKKKRFWNWFRRKK